MLNQYINTEFTKIRRNNKPFIDNFVKLTIPTPNISKTHNHDRTHIIIVQI